MAQASVRDLNDHASSLSPSPLERPPMLYDPISSAADQNSQALDSRRLSATITVKCDPQP
jgi:hypothetical protein